MLQINDVIPLKWKLLVEDDVLSTTTTTEARARAMKEKRDSKCQPGKFIFIVQCCQRIAPGLTFNVIFAKISFEGNARSTMIPFADSRLLYSDITEMHEVFFRPFLRAKDEEASFSYGIKKKLLAVLFPRDDRQPSQINSLSDGIISSKWPVYQRAADRALC